MSSCLEIWSDTSPVLFDSGSFDDDSVGLIPAFDFIGEDLRRSLYKRLRSRSFSRLGLIAPSLKSDGSSVGRASSYSFLRANQFDVRPRGRPVYSGSSLSPPNSSSESSVISSKRLEPRGLPGFAEPLISGLRLRVEYASSSSTRTRYVFASFSFSAPLFRALGFGTTSDCKIDCHQTHRLPLEYLVRLVRAWELVFDESGQDGQ